MVLFFVNGLPNYYYCGAAVQNRASPWRQVRSFPTQLCGSDDPWPAAGAFVYLSRNEFGIVLVGHAR